MDKLVKVETTKGTGDAVFVVSMTLLKLRGRCWHSITSLEWDKSVVGGRCGGLINGRGLDNGVGDLFGEGDRICGNDNAGSEDFVRKDTLKESTRKEKFGTYEASVTVVVSSGLSVIVLCSVFTSVVVSQTVFLLKLAAIHTDCPIHGSLTVLFSSA